jgi:predicted ArsR family transcriptional regulator
VTTRSRLLLLLRKHPGITVTDLAAELGLTGMGIRRHLESFEIDGLVERSACCEHRVGRPPNGWRLTPKGMELLPRAYDTFVLQLLEDMSEHVGDEGIDVVLRRRSEKMAVQYRAELADADTLDDQVSGLAQVRDRAGYVAEWHREGEVRVLIENNCAVHRVAERYPAVCAMELALFRKVLGPDVEVTRVSHTMAGDATCTYCVRPRPADAAD